MIRSVTRNTHSRFLEIAKEHLAIGAVLETNSTLFLNCPLFMQFYLCEQGALMIKGENATLAGTADPDEMASMLEFLDVSGLTAQTVPTGWQETAPSLVMKYMRQSSGLAFPPEHTINQTPTAAQILEIVKSAGIVGESAENFYSELCTKRNHGLAAVWTAETQGKAVSTAGAYAITETQAYLSGVVTLPSFRKQKIASALCSSLAQYFQQNGKTVVLRCSPEKEIFYQIIGFQTVERLKNSRNPNRKESFK